MLKGTRMIIITKKKIVFTLCGAVLLCAGTIAAVHLKSADITAFSVYEKILADEITPSEDTAGKEPGAQESAIEENAQKNGSEETAEKSDGSAREKMNGSAVGKSDNSAVEKTKNSAEEKADGNGNKTGDTKNADENFAEKPDKHIGISAKNILKHFFVLGEIKEPEEEQQAVDTPMIKSETRKADGGLKVSNATAYSVNAADYLSETPDVLKSGQIPEILIMHTHTTECYSEEEYAPGAPDRDLDENKNIVAVGNAMETVFKNHGMTVYHDKTVHDYPSYNGAYNRAAKTITDNLNAHGGIKVVLDVHRDGITKADGTKVKLAAEINGEQTAQVMIVAGSNSNLQHDKWQENFRFACRIQAKANELFPSLMRPINLRKERFNEQLTTGSLIIEVGTNGNTLAEACRGGECIAEAIAQVLIQ